MAYLLQDNPNLVNDLAQRKEFVMTKTTKPNDIIPRFLLNEASAHGIDKLDIYSYQLFITNFLSPNTPYKRLLLKWETGIGKTIGSLSIALNFINQYYSNQSDDIGSVWIIGFTEDLFKTELLKYQEFGFISIDERIKYNDLQSASKSGAIDDIERLNNFSIMLKKRLSNRKGNGFFKFIGYKALVNRIFNYKEGDIYNISNEELNAKIKSGDIVINEDFLKEFDNSFIICDEIHNTYNSLEKNNWGATLLLIFNRYKSIRVLLLTATPINNNPNELIDLLGLLIPDFQSKRDEFFKNGKLINENKLRSILQGYVSFIRDINPVIFPAKGFIGEVIPAIKKMRFIRCKMSDFQLQFYDVKEDSLYMNDAIFPLADETVNWKTGIYKKHDLEKLNNVIFNYNKDNNVITGTGLKMYLDKISSKYFQMVADIKKLIKNNEGKLFIYHNLIHITGVLFIQEILLKNGFIGEYDNPNQSTLCNICGIQLSSHKSTHEFIPTRFITVHSDLSKKVIKNQLYKYNSSDNNDGNKIRILIGGKVMKESHNLIAVRNIYIMSRPDNIPTLIQIIGRAIRSKSHIMLPAEKQNVRISVYTTSYGTNQLSLEEERYKNKLDTFEIIQRIEQIMHEAAIDKFIRYDTIFQEPSELQKTMNYSLDILPYKQSNIKLKDLNLTTFNVYYAKFEIEQLIFIIKKYFIEISPVWKYNDLLENVKNPYFNINWGNTENINEENFIIALNSLLYGNDILYTDPYIHLASSKIIQENIINKLYNSNDKFIHLSGIGIYVIIQKGEYYIMTQFNTTTNEIIDDIEIPYRNNTECYSKKIQLLDYLKYDLNNNYEIKKSKFILKWNNSNMDMDNIICDYGISFHSHFVEDIIESIFNNKKTNYDFYIKILNYYDKKGLIIWSNTVKESLKAEYKKIKKHIPVGHYILNVPRLYNSNEWRDIIDYIEYKEYKENDIIIGYDIKSKTGLSVQFKLRLPKHMQDEKTDIRTIERGYVCTFKHKSKIEELAKKLNINYDKKSLSIELCQMIRENLMERDKKERDKKTNIKWFYYLYENHD